MDGVMSYDEIINCMRYLGYHVGTQRDPKSVNERAAMVARELAGKVKYSMTLPVQIARAWAYSPKLISCGTCGGSGGGPDPALVCSDCQGSGFGPMKQ